VHVDQIVAGESLLFLGFDPEFALEQLLDRTKRRQGVILSLLFVELTRGHNVLLDDEVHQLVVLVGMFDEHLG